MSEVKKMGLDAVESSQIEKIDSNSAKLHIAFENRDKATFDVDRLDTDYTVSYRGVKFFKGQIIQ